MMSDDLCVCVNGEVVESIPCHCYHYILYHSRDYQVSRTGSRMRAFDMPVNALYGKSSVYSDSPPHSPSRTTTSSRQTSVHLPSAPTSRRASTSSNSQEAHPPRHENASHCRSSVRKWQHILTFFFIHCYMTCRTQRTL